MSRRPATIGGLNLPYQLCSTAAMLQVRDERASGTDGGGSTSGSWQTRTLQTVNRNTIQGASLAANQFVLPPGSYWLRAWGVAYHGASAQHKIKIRNITGTSDTLIGASMINAAAGGTAAEVSGFFTISVATTFELQHRVALTQATNGYGVNSGFAVIEVYAEVLVFKVA